MSNITTKLAQVWALIGFFALLSFAVYRLTGHFLVAWEIPFQWYHWLALIVNILFMAYSEGYKGFQQSYSLKFSKRIHELAQKPTALNLLLAPLFCMNYFAADKKNQKIAYILTCAIVLLILVFNQIPQPWRGILDFGVVVGLSWGIIATLIFGLKAIYTVANNHKD